MSQDDLTPANRNPWYILMTLCGEQPEGATVKDFDRELAEQNRRLWNAWAGRALTAEEQIKAAASSGIRVGELRAWEAVKDEIERLFTEQWRARNGDAPMPDLPDPEAPIEMSKTTFSKPVVLESVVFAVDADFFLATFHADVTFSCATFHAAANFYHATFHAADFSGATFHADAEFFEATFHAGADFQNATFRADGAFHRATFDAAAVFVKATFHADAFFYEATFRANATFWDATFHADADFSYATFHADAAFSRATFHADARCFRATFDADADFSSATFHADAHFLRATFHAAVTFFRATFHAGAVFAEAKFGVRDPGKHCRADFTDAAFEKPANFRRAEFLDQPPVLAATIFHDRTSFAAGPRFWPSAMPYRPHDPAWWNPPYDADEAREAYAVIRHSLSKQGLIEEEAFFHRREMRAAAHGAGVQWPFYALYWALSDYGQAVWRPLGWLVVLVGIGWYAFAGATPETCPGALSHSAANAVSFLGYLRWYYPECTAAIEPGLKVFSAAQTAISFILLFFLGLGLRSRFRLR